MGSSSRHLTIIKIISHVFILLMLQKHLSMTPNYFVNVNVCHQPVCTSCSCQQRLAKKARWLTRWLLPSSALKKKQTPISQCHSVNLVKRIFFLLLLGAVWRRQVFIIPVKSDYSYWKQFLLSVFPCEKRVNRRRALRSAFRLFSAGSSYCATVCFILSGFIHNNRVIPAVWMTNIINLTGSAAFDGAEKRAARRQRSTKAALSWMWTTR